jgi:hypothetical protein
MDISNETWAWDAFVEILEHKLHKGSCYDTFSMHAVFYLNRVEARKAFYTAADFSNHFKSHSSSVNMLGNIMVMGKFSKLPSFLHLIIKPEFWMKLRSFTTSRFRFVTRSDLTFQSVQIHVIWLLSLHTYTQLRLFTWNRRTCYIQIRLQIPLHLCCLS